MRQNLYVRLLRKLTSRAVGLGTAFALVLTSLSGAAPLFFAQRIYALSCSAPNSSVVINEIYSNPSSGSSEWVELYNTNSSSCVDISHWQLKSGSSAFANIGSNTTIAPHGYFVTPATTGGTLANSGNTLHLLPQTGSTDIDTVIYPALGVGESFGRSPDGSSNLVKFSAEHVTKGAANYVAPVTPTCSAATNGNFDGDTLGSVNGQSGWKSTGNYDQAVVDNTYGFSSFGCKSLRISNAKTSGSFGDQTFAYTVTPAGEASTGAANNHYEASFDITSTKSTAQPGLSLSVSPDDGNGSRMSYLRFDDQSDGIHVFFDDVTDAGPLGTTANFNESYVTTLSRTAAHNIKFVIDLNNGPSNDVVNVYIDGVLKATGTTWENYYRYDSEQAGNSNKVPAIDTLLFRAGGTAVPSNQGNGFLFDGVSIATSNVPHDTTPPNAPTDLSWTTSTGTVIPNKGYTKVYGGTASWTASTSPDVDHYIYEYWNDITGNQYKVGSEYTTTVTATSLPGEFNQGEGTHHFCVVAVDSVGNQSACSATFTVTYDITAPVGLANLSPEDGTFTTAAKLTSIDWTDATDAHGPVVYYYESSTSSATNADGSFADPAYKSEALADSQISTLKTPAGTYYWHVRAVDAPGNSTAWTTAWKVTVDNTAPAVPTATLTDANGGDVADNGYITTKKFTFNISDSASDVSRYQLKYWNDITGDKYEGEGNAWPATDVTLDGHSATLGEYIDEFTRGEGVHHFAFSACDAADNCSAYSTPFTVTFDAIAPATPTATPAAGTYTAAQQVTLASSDSVSGLAGIYYTTDGSTPSKTNGTLYTGAFTVSSSEAVKAIAFDNAGNASGVMTAAYVISPPAAPHVLGVSTTSTPPPTSGNEGQVLGDSVTVTDNGADSTTPDNHTNSVGDESNKAATADKAGAFLGLGWWWLAVLAVLLGLFLFILGRRSDTNEKA